MIELKTFYDEHPLNESEILSKLSQAGKARSELEPEDLFPYDQDHYGGLEATDALAGRLDLVPGKRVLDVCSGLGGTSRYLAHRHGCLVVGLDLNESRTAGAARLTEKVGLAGVVSHVRGDAMELDFEPGGFDAVIGQEAFLHIPDKPRLLGNCFRLLQPGGRLAFSDWVAFEGLTQSARERLGATIAAADIADAAQYRAYLEAAGFTEIEFEDVSAAWRVLLRERLEMFRSLEDETVRRFGAERHRRYIEAYEFFVETIAGGTLGGGRFFATK